MSLYYSPNLPEEFRFLCMMHNIGAINAEKALTMDEIAKWTTMEPKTVQEHLRKLSELGYVKMVNVEGQDKYHLSIDGIRKVLTLYS
ncbi:MAG: ArsR family transcriptional regulator [Candidatus Bathyarchaeia archaeon]|jgi:predicted transcriptional regulator|nr:ArsR family transcriptional regulator [Candidatus Bathyarchaeota archaeon A05DMB-4]MDH7595539.1 ArsR family transcriptional regulator [Candidatus Bathyarchaeota archaeon]